MGGIVAILPSQCCREGVRKQKRQTPVPQYIWCSCNWVVSELWLARVRGARDDGASVAPGRSGGSSRSRPSGQFGGGQGEVQRRLLDDSTRHSATMGFLGQLYKVETLDTRFASKTGQRSPDAQPSKWNTPEYYFYYLCFLTIPFLMVKSVYDVSGPWHPSYKNYEHLLEPGWIPGRKVDNSDAQYRSFRDNIPYMALVVILHPLLRKAYERLAVRLRSHCLYSSSDR